jgi:DNA-binding transcriptional regulator YdaS (Cro superfamily)
MSGDKGLQRAIEAAGSARKLAKLLGIRQQSVWKWKQIPAHHILTIEAATGVPREELRPDLYRQQPKHS